MLTICMLSCVTSIHISRNSNSRNHQTYALQELLKTSSCFLKLIHHSSPQGLVPCVLAVIFLFLLSGPLAQFYIVAFIYRFIIKLLQLFYYCFFFYYFFLMLAFVILSNCFVKISSCLYSVQRWARGKEIYYLY